MGTGVRIENRKKKSLFTSFISYIPECPPSRGQGSCLYDWKYIGNLGLDHRRPSNSSSVKEYCRTGFYLFLIFLYLYDFSMTIQTLRRRYSIRRKRTFGEVLCGLRGLLTGESAEDKTWEGCGVGVVRQEHIEFVLRDSTWLLKILN